MKSYYVAKTATSGFIGTFTFDQIESMLKADVIKPDYVATESSGPSYDELLGSGTATWVPVSQIQKANDPVPVGTTASGSAAPQKPVASHGWGCAIVSTSTLLGLFFGGLTGLFLHTSNHPKISSESDFMGILSIFALLKGGFSMIVCALIGAPVGALIGALIAALSRKR